MIKEIIHSSDMTAAIDSKAFVVEIHKRKVGSRIHRACCTSLKQMHTNLRTDKSKFQHITSSRYVYSRCLEEVRLFWVFEYLGVNITPCRICKPCGTKAPAVPDVDRKLYDWMRFEKAWIINMNVLKRKFLNAYATGGRKREEFTFQAKITNKLAESGMVQAVEKGGGGKDIDIVLRGGLNIQVWLGKYEPDRKADEKKHGQGRAYQLSKIEAGSIRHKLNQLPEGKKGFVVNYIPGYTMYGPPKSLLTTDKCVISSEDCKFATIYKDPNFNHLDDARRICSYLDWKVVSETGGKDTDLIGARENHVVKDEWEIMVRDSKTGRIISKWKSASVPQPWWRICLRLFGIHGSINRAKL